MFSILYVDDESALLEIGRIFLERDGDFQVETAASAEEALERMKSKRYDAIVADYQMPDMDGIALLKTVRSFALDKFRVSVSNESPLLDIRRSTTGDTPFILFTGKGREEVVIEAINAGVDFYLQKGGEPRSQFMELGHKIRQAIRRKRAEDTLYKNEERLRFALEGANDGLWDVDLPSGGVYLSPRGCEILGYTFEELPQVATIWSDLVNPLDMPATEYALDQYMKGKTALFEVEQRLRTKSGEWKWILSRGKIVERDAAGNPVRMTGTHTDITERKKAENDLFRAKKEWEIIFRAIGNPAVILGADNTVLEVNDAVLKITGKTADELKGLKCWEIFHDPDSTGPPVFCPFEKLKKSGSPETSEMESELHGGVYLISCTPVRDESGKLEKVIHIAIDITGKKRMEDLLRESEERFRTMVEQSPLSIQVLTPDGRTVQVNRAFENLWGGTFEDLKDYNMLEDEQLIRLGIMPYIRRGFAGEAGVMPAVQYDTGRSLGFGKKRWVLAHIYPVRDTNGSIRNVILMHEDITEQKLAEEALHESERKYRNIFENAILGIYRTTPEGTFLDVNPSMARIYGYDSPEKMMASISNIPRQMYVDPKVRDLFRERLGQSGFVTGMEAELFRRGRTIWISTNAHAVTDEAGKLLYYEGTIEDITLRKKAEEELRASYEEIAAAEEELRAQYDEIARIVRELSSSEGKYRSVIESVPVGMHFYELEPDGRLVFTGSNPAADTILGISHDSLKGKTIEEAFPMHLTTDIPEHYRQVVRTGKVWHTEQMDYEDEQLRGAFSVWAFPIAPDQMVAAFLDITDIKTTQDALSASEQEYRTILDSIQDAFYRTDAIGTLTRISPSGLTLLGYGSADEVIGRPCTDFYAFPEDREKLLDGIRKTGSVSQMEVTLKRKDGTPVVVSTSSHAIYDKAGTFAGVEGIFRNITRFKRAQEKLRESEEKYRTLVQHIQDGVFLIQEGIVLFCNDVFASIAGYPPEEISGMPVPSLVAPEDRDRVMEHYQNRLEGKPEPAVYVFHMLHKDGITRVPVRMSVGIGMYHGKKASIGTVRLIEHRV
jgi:PAS domain S-box-containing protein